MQKREILNITSPMQNQKVESWEDMEQILHHTFYKCLRYAPEEALGILLSEAPRNSKENREKITTCMFETFQVKKFYLANSGVLALYAAGRTTGLACDSGHNVTSVTPVFEGFTVPHARERIDFGGQDLTIYLKKLLAETGEESTLECEWAILGDIKEKLCFVSSYY